MSINVNALDTLAKSMRIAPSRLEPVDRGYLARLALTPPVADLQLFDLIDVTWLTKDVLFKSAGRVTPPLSDDLTTPSDSQPTTDIAGGIPAPLGLTGVPGSFGQLEGAVPVRLPVSVEAEWSVELEGCILEAGRDYLAPVGQSAPEVSLVFAPPLTELLLDPPFAQPTPYLVRARVRLSTYPLSPPPADPAPLPGQQPEPIRSQWIELPTIPLVVPAVGIPTVLALFRKDGFLNREGNRRNSALVVVPVGSPLTSVSIALGILTGLRSTLNLFDWSPVFALFLGGLGQLIKNLEFYPAAGVVPANGIPDLHTVTMLALYDDLPGENRPNVMAGDEVRSLILLGPSGRTAQCFEDRFYNVGNEPGKGDGQFNVVAGLEMHVLLESLHDLGSAQPPGTSAEPTVERVTVSSVGTFRAKLSSVRFEWSKRQRCSTPRPDPKQWPDPVPDFPDRAKI